MSFAIVILAAGQGTRMRSKLPKVLHTLADKPLLEHVVSTAQALQPDDIYVVYGHGGTQVKETLSHLDVSWVLQEEQLGTGHALATALAQISDVDHVLVLNADVPLIQSNTLSKLLGSLKENVLAVLTADITNPTGMGRIIRNDLDDLTAIIEEKDATAEQQQISEVNSGILGFELPFLRSTIDSLDQDNAQQEFYITDLVAIACQQSQPVAALQVTDEDEILGVNNRAQLASVERIYQRRQAENFMLAGLQLRDPSRFDLRGDLQHGMDVEIDANVVIEGRVILGDDVKIGPNVTLHNVTIGDHAVVKANSVLEDSKIGDHCTIGPFARLRPGTQLAAHAKIGNFVETKKAQIGAGSKVNHLSYVGDAIVGNNVNVGAGVITCNYDGQNKWQTQIQDGAFIGSGSELVAPVTVSENATIAAGTTLRKDAPADALTLVEHPQHTYHDWIRPCERT